MQIEQLAKQFWQQGFLLLPDFFEPALMTRMQNAIMDHYGQMPAYDHTAEFIQKSATEVVPWFPQRDGMHLFDEVERVAEMRALTEAILGENWRALYCMAMFSKRGSKGQAWHQDCPPEDPAQFNLNRLVYSMDINENTGGQVLVKPGSHKQGALSVGPVNEDFSDQVTLSPAKGTLAIIHGHTGHRVTPIAGDSRVSTNYRAIPQGTSDEITDICVYRNMRYQFSTESVVEERVLPA